MASVVRGKEKIDIPLYEVDQTLAEEVKQLAEADLLKAIQVHEKHAREDAISAVKKAVVQKFEEEERDEATIKQAKDVLNKLVKNEVRRLITEEKVRPDGRGVDQIRPLSSEVGLLPRTHGSGLFTRGQTQALSICTLGALGDVQILDGLGVEALAGDALPGHPLLQRRVVNNDISHRLGVLPAGGKPGQVHHPADVLPGDGGFLKTAAADPLPDAFCGGHGMIRSFW